MRRLANLEERTAAPGKFKVGDKVNVLTDEGWEDGTIRKAEGGDFLVAYPDGESDWHPAEDLYPPGKFTREEGRLTERAATRRGTMLYVDWSSWFDAHPYDVKKISDALQRAGASDIRTSNLHGWSNQPEVVVFSGLGEKEAANAVGKALGSDWIIVHEKDWKDGRGGGDREESRSGRRLAGLNDRASEHSVVIASDDSEPRMDRFRAELDKHGIDAEIEPVMTARGERYDLLVPESQEAEANKILTAHHARGLTRNRSYKLPNVPQGEAVAHGFTAPTIYIDGERVQIGDPDWIKMTDDIEGTVEELKKKYRGAKVTVTPTGEREVMIEIERKESIRLGERTAAGQSEKGIVHGTNLFRVGGSVQIRGNPRVLKIAAIKDEREKDGDLLIGITSGLGRHRGTDYWKADQLVTRAVPTGRGPAPGWKEWPREPWDADEERLSERSASTGEDLTHDIWREIGRWLEDEEEFELGDINDSISAGKRGEAKTLESNILFIVQRELEKKIGAGSAKGVTVELGNFENSEEGDKYRAGGDFRIWHDQDSAAEGSFAVEGHFGTLEHMTINITQASGHQKKNPPIRFFG